MRIEEWCFGLAGTLVLSPEVLFRESDCKSREPVTQSP